MSDLQKGSPAIGYNISELDEKFQKLLDKAEQELQAEIELIKPISGGYSGAQLFLSKVTPSDGLESKLVVLKLDRYNKAKNEKEQHEAALNTFSPDFRINHLVEMAFPAVTILAKRRIALFYNAAGQSLANFRPLRIYTNLDILSTAVSQVTKDLLHEWKVQGSKYQGQNGFEIVRQFFETRYTIQNSQIESLLKELLTSPEDGLLLNDIALPSPYKYLLENSLSSNERKLFLPLSAQHSDLNSGNILISSPRVPNSKLSYYLIDFLHFKVDGCCLFDILSLEMSLIVDYIYRTKLPIDKILQDISTLGNLSPLEFSSFSTEFSGLAIIINQLRSDIIEFTQQNITSYQDDWKACFNLAGLAVGLITTNTKELPTNLRVLAYIYAASHLRSYQELFNLSASPQRASQFNIPQGKTMDEIPIQLDRSWQPFFNACNSFAPDHAYVGVFGPMSGTSSEALQVLSRIPWSAIIDFDPDTEDKTHLLSSARETLNSKRFTHIIVPGNIIDDLNPDRACYWFAACGLANGKTTSTSDLSWRQWNRSQARHLDDFLSKLAISTIKPIKIIIFWNDPDFIRSIAEMAERHFYDRITFLFIHQEVDKAGKLVELFNMEAFPIDLSSVIDGIRSTIPASPETTEDIVLPVFRGIGENLEYDTIPFDILNWLEEECEVIHINLGITQESGLDNQSIFLRGRKINWFELNLNIDIERELTHDLEKQVEKDLSDRITTRIRLLHYPGAGGTTVAYRVAWNLHWTYPVLALKFISGKTVERIRDVYTRTQQSVLLLIDSNFITVNQIDTLYDQIRAGQTPAVFLIVIREFNLPKQLDRIYSLRQQLTNREAWRFASTLTKEVPQKQQALEKIARKPQYPEERTPFFLAVCQIMCKRESRVSWVS